MKRLSTIVLAAALTIVSIPLVLAAEPASNTNTGQQSAEPDHQHNKEHRAAHIQKNLDALQTQLHLKDSQMPGWSQYKTFVLNEASAQSKEREQHRAEYEAKKNDLSTPDRIQKLVARLREQSDKWEKIGQQTSAFYKTLSAEQKTIFDLHWRSTFHRRH